MSRRRSLTVAAAALAVLAVPAAAHGATYSVAPGAGACGGADLACGGFVEAAGAAASGDVFNVSAAVYPAATFTVGGVTINGAPGVVVNGNLTFAGPGAVSKLNKVSLSNAGTTPALSVTGASGLELSDAVVVGANGHGALFTAGTTNKVVRTIAVTGGSGTSAIRVESGPGSDKSLTVESSIVSGGAAGIGAKTTAGLAAGAGVITLTLRHITAAGATNGVLLDVSQGAFPLTGGGGITATLTDSIALNNAVVPNVGVLGIGAFSPTFTVTRSIQGGDPKALFADPAARNFRLRPDAAAAIGQGSVTAGESTTDIDGEDRAAAPTDLGADEFNNVAPIARLVVATKTPRATVPVTFDARGSSDREAAFGGGIVQYQWTFSDGKAETTTAPTINHVFPNEGDASASLVVVDRQGAASAPAAVALKLINGTPPVVGIVKPKNKQKIKLFTTKTKTTTVDGVKKKRKTRTRTKIAFGGLSRDANGVAQIILTLEQLPKKGAAASKKCSWYDPKKGITRRGCADPVLLIAKLKKDSKTGEWSYKVKRNLSKGSYRITALGVDTTGAVGNAGGAKLGIVKFTLT